MARLSYENFRSWTVDEVSTWLSEINLYNHIPAFERNGITGSRLAELSDRDLEQLRVIKPSDSTIIKGAIKHLITQATHRAPGLSKTLNLEMESRRPTAVTPRDGASPQAGVIKSRTMPSSTTRGTGLPGVVIEKPVKTPDLRNASAPELLDDKCRYSGWIRKQGGSHKSWKRRYLILRAGCLYYFSNETSSSAKGKFVLSGYQVSICREADVVRKYPFSLKISPMNPQVRTYYVSFGSKGELERWKKELDQEIVDYNQSISERVAQSMSPTARAPFDEEEEDEDDDSQGRIYDQVDADEESPYDKPDDPDTIYDTPADINGQDGDGVYDRVESPGAEGPKPLAPVVPRRSMVSLQNQQEGDDIYLPILGQDAVVHPGADPGSPPATPSTPGTLSHDNDEAPSDDEDTDSDDGDAYYIMFRKSDELMPQSCVFEQLDRVDADKLLRKVNFNGTYLIREGRRAGAEKVLTVWQTDRCKHYKLFKDDESYFSLTQGQRFRNLPELLQFYIYQSHLPRSDFYLTNPYTGSP